MALKRLSIVMALAPLAGGLALAAASSGTPYFATSTTGTNQDGTLYVHFTEVNLPPNGQVNYALTATVQPMYGCVDVKGKHNPTNLTSVTDLGKADPLLTVDSRGRLTGTLDVMYPDYPDYMSCAAAPGTEIRLIWVGYSNVTFSDTTNNVTPALTGNCAHMCRIDVESGA